MPDRDDTADYPAAFPTLSDSQLERLAAKGQTRQFSDGETVWQVGDRDVSCFVVVSGGIDIWIDHGDRREAVTTHAPGSFTGDVDLLSGSPVVVTGTATGESELIEITSAALKQLVVQDSQLSDVLIAAFLARRALLLNTHSAASLVVIGRADDLASHHVREFLTKNHRPFTWLQPGVDDQLDAFLGLAETTCDNLPVVIDASGTLHHRVTVSELAELTGLLRPTTERVYDLAVVGAGPGGLAATVYAASEGLEVIVIDRLGPGGQAGTSSKIENYLGFPTGISGSDLAAAALTQATKFGAEISVAHEAQGIDCSDPGHYTIAVANGTIHARSIVIATGASYRRLPIADSRTFDGRGVFYGATAMEAKLCSNSEVMLVGGGNSAGQAAVFLAEHAQHVHIMIRRDDLSATMSDYLIQRIDEHPNITLHPRTEVTALHGNERLEQITTTSGGRDQRWDIGNLFLFIGAAPATSWLEGCLALDERGFVRTGTDLDLPDLIRSGWSSPRHPVFLEASKPGIYAVGDARSGSTKRVASAVGEGSMAIHHVHRFLAERREAAER